MIKRPCITMPLLWCWHTITRPVKYTQQGRPPYHGTSGTGTGPGDIRVPDHLIVGGSQVFSFADMVCFNPSQPHHTCFHFYLLFQRYPTMKIITRGEAMRIHQNIRHPVFFLSVPANTAGTAV